MEISPFLIGVAGFIILLILLFTGIPVGIALLAVSFLGTWAISGMNVALHQIGSVPYKTSVVYLWSLIPLFVLMGQFAYRFGLGKDLFLAAFKWLGHFRGGLAVTTIGASAGFAAICGDNIAAAVTMTSVCLPEMRKYQYDDGLSLASISSGAVLSFLIPPSLGFIMYGILANVSISALFIAGIIPGILVAIGYIAVVYVTCRIHPEMGPKGPSATWGERIISLKYLWGMIILLFLMFAGMYTGFITPTEAGAVGAAGTLLVGFMKREVSWKNFKLSVSESVDSIGMVFLLIIGAWAFAPFLSLTTIPKVLIDIMSTWSPWLILGSVLVFFFIGGLFFEAVILMIITIPLFLPLWYAAGFDMVWFGVVLMIIVVLGGLTPPVGLIVYVVTGMSPGSNINRTFRAVLPFIGAAVVIDLIVILFPSLATWLPSMMK